ncbi:MAG: hypothetical protein KDA96_29395, partial [Planctomycetaceae bacterium]|nr:hypothetical protein [Planctomycetaceae bacterium]
GGSGPRPIVTGHRRFLTRAGPLTPWAWRVELKSGNWRRRVAHVVRFVSWTGLQMGLPFNPV